MRVWQIESYTDSEVKYQVLLIDEMYRCSCPSYIHREKECKHIKDVKAGDHGEGIYTTDITRKIKFESLKTEEMETLICVLNNQGLDSSNIDIKHNSHVKEHTWDVIFEWVL